MIQCQVQCCSSCYHYMKQPVYGAKLCPLWEIFVALFYHEYRCVVEVLLFNDYCSRFWIVQAGFKLWLGSFRCFPGLDTTLTYVEDYSNIHRRYYTVARRYEFYVRVARTISHEFAALTREILFLPREHKFHIFEPTCNVLFIIWRLNKRDTKNQLGKGKRRES